MKFRVDGTLYDIELNSMTFDEGEIIEDFAGVTLMEFQDAVRETRIRPLRALVLIAKRRAGESVEWADLGGLDLMELGLSIIEENGLDIESNGQNDANVAALQDILAGRRQAKARPKKPPQRRASS